MCLLFEEKWERKKITRAANADIETRKKLLQICGTISKATIIEILLFVLATAARNNKLPFSCSTLSSKTFHKRRRSIVREGKFNQVIKHFLLKHQLNLMVFLLPLLLYAGESLSCAVNNKRDEEKSNCTRFFSVSTRV